MLVERGVNILVPSNHCTVKTLHSVPQQLDVLSMAFALLMPVTPSTRATLDG
jgi:hypothetical protein